MHHGICHLSIVPIRSLAEDTSELVTQLLYGDPLKILEKRKYWSKIRDAYDGCEGWIRNNQFIPISKENYKKLVSSGEINFSADLVSYVSDSSNVLLPIVLGSNVKNADLLSHKFEGTLIRSKGKKSDLVSSALYYLNAPFLWGGKTPFGVDAAGFTQMVYKINGYKLLRRAEEQATQGEPLSFIEESEPGDLAFFDNNEGQINHVGLIMKDNFIIHVFGKVRIDRLDHTGIFNNERRKYTHKLRVIKKII
ncbi:NlpC/P60 family protein [uncultured Eudoraea sp.]|uniref:C40 family peptidase n=1 Tax=uncultured Eudoraea sp. TaxID=1035614 RepID=UPI0026262EF1|nr:NlpC/P60 family protein [uncultured Eudoraea sp.]